MTSLAQALGSVLDGLPPAELRRATERLIEVYRSGAPPRTLAVGDAVTAAAYAAYRMPATHAAVGRALRMVTDRLPAFAPESVADLGGGTGAALWAVADALPTVREASVVDASRAALALGERIGRLGGEVVAGARWTLGDVLGGDWEADLATVSYVFGELASGAAERVVRSVTERATAVVVIEPGTPRGYAAILTARSVLLGADWRVVAPCPHARDCPLAHRDWCHFSVRLDRSGLHRRVKGGELGYEDEKFSFVAAVAPGVWVDSGGEGGVPEAGARVLRHPLRRKGFVEFQLCRPDGTAGREVVTRKDREGYRVARDVDWGDELQALS